MELLREGGLCDFLRENADRLPGNSPGTGGNLRTDCHALRQAEEFPAGRLCGLRENLAGEGIPAFRIVNGRGELSGAFYFTIPDLQKTLLEEEGVPVNWDGRI